MVAAVLILVALTGITAATLNRGPEAVYSASACGSPALIRIVPHGSVYPAPIMLSTPATFNITVEGQGTAYHPNILLVMTNSCYQGLTGPVLVNWTGGSTSFPKASFVSIHDNNAYIPPIDTTQGTRYRVSGLKDHIGVNGTADDALYYAYGPFLSRPINQTIQSFKITLPSNNPRMLVYALGKSACSNLFNMRVPPTKAGFVVPDLAPALMASASFGAFGLYAVKRRKK